MDVICLRTLKKMVLKRSEECGYELHVDNPRYKNQTKIEAIKAHWCEYCDETSELPASKKPAPNLIKLMENWISELEDKYL